MAMSRNNHENDLKALLSTTQDEVVVDPNDGTVTTNVNAIVIEPTPEALQALSLIISHMKTNMEVNGIQVDAGPGISTVVAAGIPTPLDGGAGLKATMAVQAALPQIVSQSNNGTGLVD